MSEIYIYRGKDGEKVVSDRSMPTDTDYDLLTQRDTVKDTGHILANRRVTNRPGQTYGRISKQSLNATKWTLR